MKPLTIGVTACEKGLETYTGWLESGIRFGYAVTPVILPYTGEEIETLRRTNLEKLDALDAIVFTGGWDVEPHRFGVLMTDEELKKLDVESTPNRDAMEWALAEKSLTEKLPVLGICRGLQFINVVKGGTLFLDVEKQGATTLTHKKVSVPESRYHAVALHEGTALYKMLGSTHSDFVSSRHHQAADKLGAGLVAVAYSQPDNLIEAIESANPDECIYLVQWHPERMWLEAGRDGRPELDNAFSENLLKGFLEQVWLRRAALASSPLTAR